MCQVPLSLSGHLNAFFFATSLNKSPALIFIYVSHMVWQSPTAPKSVSGSHVSYGLIVALCTIYRNPLYHIPVLSTF